MWIEEISRRFVMNFDSDIKLIVFMTTFLVYMGTKDYRNGITIYISLNYINSWYNKNKLGMMLQ